MVVQSATREFTRQHPASFRDPSGFIYRSGDGQLLRQVNPCYTSEYRRLMESGLYEELVSAGLLVEHEELSTRQSPNCQVIVLRPRELPFISYPYEWPFHALKDAALLTLRVQLRALAHGMVSKDTSAFNVQFEGCRPLFIDTLSFQTYEEGRPWDAYGQFCRHFLAPLALMAKVDVGLNRLLLQHLDGIPLPLASKLLPWRTRLSPSALVHIHWHASMIRKHSDTSEEASLRQKKRVSQMKVSLGKMKNLVHSLLDYVKSLSWRAGETEWADYYDNNSYSRHSFDAKRSLVLSFLNRSRPHTVWDFGANTGEFSRLAADHGAHTLALDIDAACVDRNYLAGSKRNDSRLLPLCVDLCNPTPALGWLHAERSSLVQRGPCDMGMALALVHHLAISNNTPLSHVARFFRQTCKELIIEWVPKGDPQVQRLLRSRQDIFDEYHLHGFKAAFAPWFETLESQAVGSDGRLLFRMKNRNQP